MSSYRYCDGLDDHNEHEWTVYVDGLGHDFFYCLGVDDSAELVAANRVVSERRREVVAAQDRLREAVAAAGAVAWKNRSHSGFHFDPDEPDEAERWAHVPGVWMEIR